MSIIIPEIDFSLHPDQRSMTVETKQETTESMDSYQDHIASRDAAILLMRKAELNQRRGITTAAATVSCEEDTTEAESTMSSHFGRLELGSTYEWSDSSSLSDPSEPSSGDLHDTMEAIREEAARIDTIMALDQLDTTKQELQMQKKIVEARRLEVHDLRDLVSLKDDLLSSVELERDLLRAEISKLRDQIKEANEAERERAAEETLHVTSVRPVEETEPIVVQANATAATENERLHIAPIDVQQIQYNEEPQPARRSSRQGDEQPILEQIRGKEENKSCLFVPRSLFRKKRRTDCRDENIRELGRLLRSSLDTSEELRKRIAVLSAYYESVIERMQNTLNSTHLEKNRMATDLATQIVRLDEAHRRTAEDLRRKLKQKEKELAAVREVQI